MILSKADGKTTAVILKIRGKTKQQGVISSHFNKKQGVTSSYFNGKQQAMISSIFIGKTTGCDFECSE